MVSYRRVWKIQNAGTTQNSQSLCWFLKVCWYSLPKVVEGLWCYKIMTGLVVFYVADPYQRVAVDGQLETVEMETGN